MIRWLTALLALGAATQARALDVRIAPADFLVLNPTNPNRGYSDVVLHTVAVRADKACRLSSLTVEMMAGGQARLVERVPIATVAADSKALAEDPVPASIGAQVLNKDGLAGVFGKPTTLAASADLRPGQAAVAIRRHYSVGFVPDAVRVSAACASGERAQASVPVKAWRSAIAYRLPLEGVWLMQSAPTIESHHRLNPATEFAMDFFKSDAEGRQYKGDRIDPASYFGWGQPVMAAADGVVTRVISDQVQDRHAYLPRPGETPPQTGARLEAAGIARLKADFAAGNAGNLVVVRHAAGGVVEYSAYGHLKPGSVAVKVGDRVTRGQKIAEVGDTGDSPAVHLHFQINAGPDPFFDRSLPVAFDHLRLLSGPELGRLVVTQ